MNGSGQRSVAVIPARGGSKRLPRKNVRPLAGVPLIVRSIETAIASQAFERVVVSTDDEEIAEVSRLAGAEILGLRPAELATDVARSIDVVMYELERLPGFSHGALIQATSPLMNRDDIRRVMSTVREPGVTSAVSVTEIDQAKQLLFARNEEDLRLDLLAPRCTLSGSERVVQLNGAIYAFEVSWLLEMKRFIDDATVGCLMPIERSVDVDEETDWQFAEFLIKQAGGSG